MTTTLRKAVMYPFRSLSTDPSVKTSAAFFFVSSE